MHKRRSKTSVRARTDRLERAKAPSSENEWRPAVSRPVIERLLARCFVFIHVAGWLGK